MRHVEFGLLEAVRGEDENLLPGEIGHGALLNCGGLFRKPRAAQTVPDKVAPCRCSAEDAIAFHVDDLLPLHQREVGSLGLPRETVGPDEAMALGLAVDDLLDDAAELVLAALLRGRRMDGEAVVLDALDRARRLVFGGLAATEERLEE